MVDLETINLLVQIVGVSAAAIATVVGVRSYIVSNRRAKEARAMELETRRAQRARERADSLATDLHKWMDMPYGIGCTLVKDRAAHFKTFVFGHEAEYAKSGLELSEDQLGNPHNLSIQWSRNFTSLKAYMLLRSNGSKKYCELVQQNLDQINYLADLIRKEPDFEITVPVVSNAVCFRYKPKGLVEADVEKLNKLIYGFIRARDPG
jgi:glutamate/tyrosine decarboxylase-like PLP-dependent enzyme